MRLPSASRNTTRTAPAPAWALAILLLFCVASWYAITQPAVPIGTNWSAQSSWLQPVERNAFLRLPRTGPVHGITFAADGKRGWALGSLDMLLATTDGGATWSVLSHDAPGAVTLAFSDDGRRGWAFGVGRLRRSSDGGRHWTEVRDPLLEGTQWTAMAFDPAGRSGVLVGVDGMQANTWDGGATWHARGRRRLGVPDQARAPTLTAAAWSGDGATGWIVGDHGTVRLTTDSGQNWTDASRDIPADASLTAVQFVRDGLRGWITSADGRLFASTDGGYRWRPVETGAPVGMVRFAGDGLHGWALAVSGALLATQDGGVHWSVRTLPFASTLRGLAVADDASRIWLCGERGVIASTDGGVTWQAQTSDALNRITRLAFDGAGVNGWAVGEGGMVLHSADSGATWSAQPARTTAYLSGVAVDGGGTHVWIAGEGGLLLRSADSGAHWAPALLARGENLRAVAFARDRQRGIVIGQQGAILLTSDGGITWRSPRAPSLGEMLDDMAMFEDGNVIWVAAASGALFRSADAGATWQPAAWDQVPGAREFDASIVASLPRYGPDGKHGWAQQLRGAACTVALTADGGASWRQMAIPRPVALSCPSITTYFQDDGTRGWVGAPQAAMLVTKDSGAHLQKAWDPYRRLPGLWYWVLLPFFIQGMVLSLRSRRQPASHAAAASMFVDDDAIGTFAADRLEFGPLARGLSRFLRNPKTSPPLTLAITGDWGTGKSSLMRLLCADLRRYGQRPIWFNAWHHQKDEQMFPALLGAIQAQAAPSSCHPAGWIFRLKLLWLRSKRHFLLSFGLLTLVTSLFIFPFQHTLGELDDVLDWAGSLFGSQSGAPVAGLGVGHVGMVAQLLAVLTAARVLYKGMQSFGVDPALMFKGLSEQASIKQASAQNTFRTTFARQFNEVADALPYRMTIVVDDLDRCRPENILEVLETVNFLTTSGRCFVVFGMASERVSAALGMAFEQIADELGDQLRGDGAGADADPATVARARRRAYARDYLEKLINLEITVPQRSDLGAHALLTAPPARAASLFATAAHALGAVWPLSLVAAAVAAGVLLGTTVRMPAPPAAPAVPVAAAAPGPASAPAPVRPQPTSVRQPALPSFLPRFEPGQRSPILATYGPSLMVGIALVAALVVHGLLRLRAQAIEVQDSLEFKHGLAVWTELAASRRRTPRAIKRWGNRMRYFAMLQQGSEVDEDRGERVRRELLARLRSVPWLNAALTALPDGPAPSAQVRRTVIREGRLIAIGAAHEAYGAQWLERLNSAANMASDMPPDTPLARAFARFVAVTGTVWEPVSEAEAEAFAYLLAGVKLPDQHEAEPESLGQSKELRGTPVVGTVQAPASS